MKTTLLILFLISCTASAKIGLQYEVISIISTKAQSSPIEIKIVDQDIDHLIDYSLNQTTTRLSFSLESSDNSKVANIDASGKAHCVGYCRYFMSILSAALQKNGVDGYAVTHVRAKIHFLGVNAHQFFKDPAFKDHDVCMITNVNTGEKIIVDPSLSEVLGNVIVKQ